MPQEQNWNNFKVNNENIKEKQPLFYNLDSGIEAELSYKEFLPKTENLKESNSQGTDKEKVLNRGVMFLPGLSMNPDDQMLKGLGQSYAESSQSKTYIIKTELKQDKNKTKENKELDLFYEESLAISRFIKEKNISEVTIVGYSIGGPKTIDTAYILQNDPSIKINGIVLLGSPGLYEQNSGDLKNNLIKDSLFTPIEALKKKDKIFRTFTRGFHSMIDVGSNLISGSFNSDFREKIKRDFSEMEHYNPRISELKVPVIIIVGTKDQVIEAGKIIPPEEEAKIKNDLQIRKTENLNKEPDFSREKYLKENIFKQSPFVRMITPEKMGKHGLPVFRPEGIANASMHLLERYHREKK